MTLKAITHDIGRSGRFWHFISLRRFAPIYHRFDSNEMQYPFRKSYSHIIHIPPFKLGIVLGKWGKQERTEEAAIMAAISGRSVQYDQVIKRRTTVEDLINEAVEY